MNDRSIGYVILVSMVVRAVAVALLCAAALLFLAQAASAVELSVQTEDGRAIDRASVPLFFEQVEVDIHDQVAAARHWFHFRNDLAEDVEVTCRFALGPGELVEGFSYYNGDERIVGEVLEKQAAEEVYQELTQIRRQDPGLLEQDRDRFRFRVYPVQPGEVKPVEVTSIRPLAGREGWVEYVVPRENLPDGAAVFSLRVDITDDLPVREVGTAGFQGTVTQFGPRHWRVEFEAESVIWSGDLKIRYRLAADDYSLRFLATRPDETDGTFLLLVSPRDGVEAAEVIGRDIVFVVDISGSMSGPPLEQTRAALLHIIGQLHPDDRFDVVAFDDDQYPLFGSLRMADGPSRDEAVRRVRALETKGGTNILGALGRALDELEAVVAHRPRAIVFLTDGQGNEPPATVLAEVRRRDSGIRVFSFGVGEGVHRDFLERLARENRGLCALVQDSRTLEAEIRRLYDRMAMPLMVDLDVRFEGMQVHSVYPGRLPDLYRDSEVVLMGRYSQAGAGKVRVTGRLKGVERTLELDVALPRRQTRHAWLEKLWAARRIADLSDLLMDRGEDEALVKEITRLGIVHNLVTEYTTFLAVPESLKTDEIKEMIRKGTSGYDRRLVDSVEGIRLSMTAIPPGDPVLTVRAPAQARSVTAYFPFGLVKRLAHDPVRGHWSVRFLVPRDVADGRYVIRVHIVHADGRLEWRDAAYYIDSTAPEFDAVLPETASPGACIPIEVDPFEPVLEAYAYLPGGPGGKVPLPLDPGTGVHSGRICLPCAFPEGPVTVRIVVRDLARNRFERDFEVWEGEDGEY